jgi:hypothetical protein
VSLLYWSFQTKGKAAMRKNSEIKAIPILDADTARKIPPKSIPLVFVTSFLRILKNLQKIRRKTVTPQNYSGLHIMETITGLFRPGRAAPAFLSFIHYFERAGK